MNWMNFTEKTPRHDLELAFVGENQKIRVGFYNPEDGYFYEVGGKYKPLFWIYIQDLPLPNYFDGK